MPDRAGIESPAGARPRTSGHGAPARRSRSAPALLQAFLNTHYDLTAEHGGEVLADPAALRAWLAACSLIGGPGRLRGGDVERAVAVR